MTPLFALAIFCSATLLFMVQPLTGKILLPVLGGSAAVWGTCLVFFQAGLLLGYLYAHLLGTRVPPRWQGPVHVALLVVASLTLPIPVEIGSPPGGADPRWWLFGTLAFMVGVPFVALSASAPLLQRWFSQTADPHAADPYFLYAASNAGSLLGLLAYPLLEPFASRSLQVTSWSGGFWLFAVLIGVSAWASAGAFHNRTPVSGRPRDAAKAAGAHPARTRPEAGTPATATRRLSWVGLALVPSALLLGVTQHLTTDVVSVPFLWVLPLSIYLLTLIAAFSTMPVGSTERWGMAAGVAALVTVVLLLAELRYPLAPIAGIHLVAFAIFAMSCHVRLAALRPDPSHLTSYFLCVSLGGVLGGVAAALVAPLVPTPVRECAWTSSKSTRRSSGSRRTRDTSRT